MATKEDSSIGDTPEAASGSVQFWAEPGAKVRITVDVGNELVDGKVPLTVRFEQALHEPVEEAVQGQQLVLETPRPARRSLHVPAVPSARFRSGWETLKSRVRIHDLALWLFIAAVAIYLLTRLVGLTQFPIYFFTDEAIQSLSVIDLIQNGYRDPNGVFLPTYFRNGEYYNIGLSVYLQWLPAILFGKSAVATRAMSVLVTVLAAISVGLMLRDIFKLKYWWTGVLFLSITPSWFLHSRTAFETAEFVAIYAGALCAYLYYRYRSARYLYLAFVLGALAFYSYSPAQVIVPLTALGLLLSDWRYHWQNRGTVLKCLGLGVLLALPFVRYYLTNPNVQVAHLHTLWSYWFEKIPLAEKIDRYLTEFGFGLSPWYWYIPNNRDLARHLMMNYGHIMILTLPFALLGLAYALRNLRQSAWRAILIVLIISPAAAALVQVAITRVLVFVIPMAMLTAVGLERVLLWIQDPRQRLAEMANGPRPSPWRIGGAILILAIAAFMTVSLEESINRIALILLALLLALHVSGLFTLLAQSLLRPEDPTRPGFWKLSQPVLALLAFIILAAVNVRMLNDALTNGPLWYRDYGLGGMQYGAFQIFDVVDQYVKENPEARVIFSPDWANGADVVARYFLDDFSSIKIGSFRGHTTEKLPLDDNTLFIMTPLDYAALLSSDKLTDIRVERIIPYPDGMPGFYFVNMRYVDNIDEIFAAEKAIRDVPQEATVNIDGQEVKLRFSYLDSEFQDKFIALVFDNDPYTVAKTFEANPFVIEMTFPTPRTLNGFSVIIGSARVQVTLKSYPTPGAEPVIYTFEGQGTKTQPQLSFDLPAATTAQVVQVEVRDLNAPDESKVHIWELKLR